MSLCSRQKGQLVVGLLIVLAITLISSPVLAQNDENPKYDVFVGYQWLHPGGTVPAPFGDPNNPTAFNLPDLPKGAGVAFTYNFDRHWGAEFDYGTNGDNNVVHYENTLSAGPRFIWRTERC